MRAGQSHGVNSDSLKVGGASALATCNHVINGGHLDGVYTIDHYFLNALALSSRFIYDVQEFKLAIVLVLAEAHGVSAVPHPVEQGLILIGAAHSDMTD